MRRYPNPGSRRPVATAVAGLALVLATQPAPAATIANGPDDICAPAADPCLVSQVYEVQAPAGELDFGLRTVRMTSSGGLERSVNVLCGAFVAEGGGGHVAVDTNEGGGSAGTLTVTSRRACSGDGVTPCLDDATCAGLLLGTCSVGTGTIDIDAKLKGNGGPGGVVILRAAGDVTVAGQVNINSTIDGEDGGLLEIESFMGSVDLSALVKARSGAPAYYALPDNAGSVILRAFQDVTAGGEIDAGGGATGGTTVIDAGRDAVIGRNIVVNAGGLAYAQGGSIEVDAGRDIVVDAASGTTRLLLNGGSGKSSYNGTFYPGAGGYCRLSASGNIDIGEKAVIEAKSSTHSYIEGYPYGGYIYLFADGVATVAGDMVSKGYGRFAHSRTLHVQGDAGVTIAPTSFLNARSKFSGGKVVIRSDGPVDINGTIEARADILDGYYFYSGYGGAVYIEGGADVDIGGSIFNGSDGGSEGIHVDVCRLTMQPGGRIDQTHGSPDGDGENNEITVRESMTMLPGSELLTKASVGAVNRITYRDPSKPPVLLGDVNPPADLAINPSLVGCPVCGNSEIDQGESCDDGNTIGGDGCRDDCQDEGCVAQTPPPGFPTVPICDDADACTIDICDPLGHACDHVASCEEGVACTSDACVASTCEHTPIDALCDDGNDCTDDVCNGVTGCVYANLSGNACEDGDLCTVTGTCSAGTCVPSDASLSQNNRIVARFRDGPDNDKLKLSAELPLADLTTVPTDTGLVIELRDAEAETVFAASIAAGDFQVSGTKYYFRDPHGLAVDANGVRSVTLALKPSAGIARARVSMSDTEIPRAVGQPVLSLSLLFGTDPALDECLTARRIPCTASATKTTCKD